MLGLLIMGSVILGEFAGIAGLTAIMVDILREWIERLCGCEVLYLRPALDTGYLRGRVCHFVEG